MKKKLFLSLLIANCSLFIANYTLAATFNPNNVISDEDYTNDGAMNANYIQEFLTRKGSELATITWNVDGQIRRVADIFYDCAKKYKVSQKLLIATAQKEQSAITSNPLTQSQKDALMGYGVCDSCDEEDWAKYKGIYNQIDNAAWQFRAYYDNPTRYSWRQGVTKTVDGQTVTMENKATAGLYNYTPHIHGNQLFWDIWQEWFAIRHPSGTLIKQTGGRQVYLLQDGKRYPITSQKVLQERKLDPKTVVEIPKNEFEGYSRGGTLTYSDGTLIKVEKAIYIISNNKARQITSPTVLRELGYEFKNATPVVPKDFQKYYSLGQPVQTSDIHPDGVVLKQKDGSSIYVVENGQKRQVVSPDILKNRYDPKKIVKVPKTTIDKYQNGQPVGYKDGTLIKDQETKKIYVIENGQKRNIASWNVFANLGYKKKNVKAVDHKTAQLHSDGEQLTD